MNYRYMALAMTTLALHTMLLRRTVWSEWKAVTLEHIEL